IQLNGPQAVEKPNQNLMCSPVPSSESSQAYQVSSIPPFIVTVQGVFHAPVSIALQFDIYLFATQPAAPVAYAPLIYIANVAVPLAASGALVQCAPSLVSQVTGLKNFGSKILGGITKAAGWVAPTLNKVQDTSADLVSMINHAVGAVMGSGAKIAG
ncbi:MAG: hypothetical protein EZS28_046868, partial [Streblomastix strix]